MKTIYYLILSGILIISGSCRKDEPGFNMTYLGQINIPAGLDPFTLHTFTVQNIPADTLAYFSTNGVTSARILKINPYSFRMVPIYSGADYRFIELVSVIIVSPDNPDVRQEVYFRDNIPLNIGDLLDVYPNLPDIKPFIMRNRFNIEIVLRLRDISPQTIETHLDFTFRAKT